MHPFIENKCTSVHGKEYVGMHGLHLFFNFQKLLKDGEYGEKRVFFLFSYPIKIVLSTNKVK